MAGSQALGLAVLQYSKIELIVSVCDNCTGWCEYYGIWRAEGQVRHLWWQPSWPSYWMSLKIQIYRNGVNANHLSSEPPHPPPPSLPTKSDNYTRSLPFASHSHLLSEKQVFLPGRFCFNCSRFWEISLYCYFKIENFCNYLRKRLPKASVFCYLNKMKNSI